MLHGSLWTCAFGNLCTVLYVSYSMRSIASALQALCVCVCCCFTRTFEACLKGLDI